MTASATWGKAAQQALAPYHVRNAARRAYGMAPRFSREPQAMGQAGRNPTYWAVWGLLSTASMAASAYHGYKRNESIGWALWWGFCGAFFPIITPTIAVVQGFGERERG